jgi:hypothetical protein
MGNFYRSGALSTVFFYRLGLFLLAIAARQPHSPFATHTLTHSSTLLLLYSTLASRRRSTVASLFQVVTHTPFFLSSSLNLLSLTQEHGRSWTRSRTHSARMDDEWHGSERGVDSIIVNFRVNFRDNFRDIGIRVCAGHTLRPYTRSHPHPHSHSRSRSHSHSWSLLSLRDLQHCQWCQQWQWQCCVTIRAFLLQ